MSTQSLSKTPYAPLRQEYEQLRAEGLDMLKQVSEDTTDSRIAIRCWPHVLHQETRQKLVEEFNRRNALVNTIDTTSKYRALEDRLNNLIKKINTLITSHPVTQDNDIREAERDFCFLTSLKEIVFDNENEQNLQGLLASLAAEAMCPTGPLKTVIVACLSSPSQPLLRDELSYKITTTDTDTHLKTLLMAARATRVATRTMMLHTNFINKLKDEEYKEQAKKDALKLLQSYQFGRQNPQLLQECTVVHWRLADTILTFKNIDANKDPISANYRTSAQPFLKDLQTRYIQTARRLDLYTSQHNPSFESACLELKATIDPSSVGMLQHLTHSASLFSSFVTNTAKSFFSSASTPPRSSSFSSSKSDIHALDTPNSTSSTPTLKGDSRSLSSDSSDEQRSSSAQLSNHSTSINNLSSEDQAPTNSDSPSQETLNMEQQPPSMHQEPDFSVTHLQQQLDVTHISKEPSTSIESPAEDAQELLTLIQEHQEQIINQLSIAKVEQLKPILSTIRTQGTNIQPLPTKPKDTLKSRFVQHSIEVLNEYVSNPTKTSYSSKITSAVSEFKTQIEALIKK